MDGLQREPMTSSACMSAQYRWRRSIAGIQQLADSDPRSPRLRRWALVDLSARFAGRTLGFDEPVARTWGDMTARIRRGIAIPTMDSLIAATALHHDLVLVTRNVADMRHFDGLSIENPWS
ncbi:MAG: PIN domain-containing protein [Pseudomonadota bacterium]